MSFPCLYIKQVEPLPPPSKITLLARYFQVSLHTHAHLMLCNNDFLLKILFVSVFLLTNRDSKRERMKLGSEVWRLMAVSLFLMLLASSSLASGRKILVAELKHEDGKKEIMGKDGGLPVADNNDHHYIPRKDFGNPPPAAANYGSP